MFIVWVQNCRFCLETTNRRTRKIAIGPRFFYSKEIVSKRRGENGVDFWN